MKVYISLFFLCLSFYVSAQISIGPVIGYDFATLETQRIFREGTLVDGYWQDQLLIERADRDDGSGRRSIVFGFQVQKMLFSKWSVAFRGSYARKSFIERIDNFLPTLTPNTKIFYRQIGLSVLFNRKIKDKISIGIGPNITYFTKLDVISTDTKKSYGLDFQLGYHLGPVYLAMDYTKMLKIVDATGYMTGASSLAITGTYFFELRKRK